MEVIVDEGDVYYVRSNLSMLIQPQSSARLYFEGYWISADEEYIVFAAEVQKAPSCVFRLTQNWRHSYTARYYAYHIPSRTTTPLIPNEAHARVDYAKLSPTGAKVAYVFNHDVYIRDLHTETTERVTYDGGEEIFNGVADWVFEGSPLPFN
jgi:hypothetical protein